jgi:hypothetical protein
MRPVTPSARSRWRTSVVLPAPRSPCSAMKAWPGRLRGQRRGKGPRGTLRWATAGFLQWGVTINALNSMATNWFLQIQEWAQELGFSQIGVAGVDLSRPSPDYAWLARGFHGDMAYMAAMASSAPARPSWCRARVSVITARMDYLPRDTPDGWPRWSWTACAPFRGIVSVYARGRDYHKVLRSRLQNSASASREAWALLVTGCSPIRRRCWRPSWPRAAARAGAANTRWCSTARRARCFFWARSMWTWRCRQ